MNSYAVKTVQYGMSVLFRKDMLPAPARDTLFKAYIDTWLFASNKVISQNMPAFCFSKGRTKESKRSLLVGVNLYCQEFCGINQFNKHAGRFTELQK